MPILRSAWRWARILGLIGFLGGFLGPMILMPDANQGPMFGIFISGPAGFVLGLVGGALAAILRRA